MKKRLLTLLITTMITSLGFSQSLSLSDANGPIANNGTIIIEGDINTTLVSYVYVTNNSAATITVGVDKEYISVIQGTENTYCWGNCFDSSVYVSPITIPIGAGVTNNMDFIGDYKPHGIVGISTIKYIFYDANNTSDAVAVNVQYSGITVGLDELLADVEFSEAYPNPASNHTSFNYVLPEGVRNARLMIYDMLGNAVKERIITDMEGKIVINTNELTSGLYFYSLVVNDQIAFSKKLIISR